MASSPAIEPALRTPDTTAFKIEGEVGRLLSAVTENWLLPAPYANPAILEMFRNRNRQPHQKLVPWAGEFAGKYLTHAVQILRLTRDSMLHRHVAWFVRELVALQSDNGYLGPWPDEYELRPGNPACEQPWDAWGHYHCMVGLMLWHDTSDDQAALDCAMRIADLLCNRFHGVSEEGKRLHDTGAHEMNLAPAHSLTMLYQRVSESRYLDLAKQIVEEFAIPPAGDYLNQGRDDVPFHETPKPRWESLHPIMALADLYHITGDADMRTAFVNLWWSMLEGDRHNSGGFTSGEKATGDPYNEGAIETCCTVAWMAMSVEMLKLTGESVVADELELSMLNSGVGMISPSGRWVTYNTPMEGVREASAHTIVFQARAGQPELNCCSVNGPRCLGMLSDWAIMADPKRLLVNYYGPYEVNTASPSGGPVHLHMMTDYPRDNAVHLLITPESPSQFVVALRIPYWSRNTIVRLDGKRISDVTPGAYLEIDRVWQGGERIEIEFDFSLHYWFWKTTDAGHGLASIYRGPVLLAWDPRFDDADADALPVIDPTSFRPKPAEIDVWLQPWMLLEGSSAGGKPVQLCDYASAGAAGNAYRTWLPVQMDDSAKRDFSRANPLRSVRVDELG